MPETYNPFKSRAPGAITGGYTPPAPTGSGMSMAEKLRAAAVKRAASAAQGVTTTPPAAGPTLVRPNANPTPVEGPLEPPKVDIATPSPTPQRTINTRTNEGFINGAPAPVTVAAPENTNVATPSAPQRSINTVTGEAFLDGKKVEPPAPPAPPKKSVFDLQREEVDADQAAEEKRRMEAILRAMNNRGISDSGIRLGQERSAMADIAMAAGRQRSAIGQEESRQDYDSREADKGRTWASGENTADRNLTTSESALGRTFQSNENKEARVFTASENALGRKFTTSEREAIQVYSTLERIGIQDFESAEAALGRDFTTKEREAIQVWQNANREDEQTYGTSERTGAQDHQVAMYDKDVKTSVQLGVLNALVGSLDPKAPDFMTKVEEYTTRLFGPGIISAKTGGAPTPSGGAPTGPTMIRDVPSPIERFTELPNPLDPPKPTFPGPTGPTIPGRTGPTQPTGPFGLPGSVDLPSAGDVADAATNNPVTRAIAKWWRR